MNKLIPCFLGGEEEEASAHSSSILEALSAVLTRPGRQDSSAFNESLLVIPILFSAFKTLRIQRFQQMNSQHLKTQSARLYRLPQVKTRRNKATTWPAQGNMVSQRKNRKESKRICQWFAQKAFELLTQATLVPFRLPHSEGFVQQFWSQASSHVSKVQK